MAMKESPKKEATEKATAGRRSFPHHTLEESLPLAQKIADEMGGRPMNRLLLAEAIGIKPSSSNFRLLLSSAYKYNLIDGTEKSDEIGLTDTGVAATQRVEAGRRTLALRQAALKPHPFGRFLEDYKNKKLPSDEMLPKILATQYSVPAHLTADCARLITQNARFTGMIRDIGGSPHVLLEGSSQTMAPLGDPSESVEQEADYIAPH